MEALIWKWARFVVGVILLVGFTAVHVLIKELPAFLLASPLFIMGFYATDLIKDFVSLKGGKK